MQKISTLAIAGLFLFGGCDKLDKQEDIPSYIYISDINLSVSTGQGTGSESITDAWVYVNDNPVAIRELPCLVPILDEGYQKISIAAGIKNDGLSDTRVKYPMYQLFTTSGINLQRGKVDTLTPTVTYYPSSIISIWEENFNDQVISFSTDAASDTSIVWENTTSEVFEGAGSGLIDLSSSQDYFKATTTSSFPLPKNGKSVYVELNYNTNNSMLIGFTSYSGSTPLASIENTGINPSNGTWKKIYVDLTQLVSEQVNATSFKFYIVLTKDDGNTTVHNLIDNFKVVYAK